MYQRSLTSMIYKLFDMSSGKLAEELHKLIIRKFEKRKVHSPFIVFDLVDMQLISKFNKIIHFLLCIFDAFSKCTWFIPLKDEKGIAITEAFQKIFDETNRKPNNYR